MHRGQHDFGEAGPRARRHQPQVARDFPQVNRVGPQGAGERGSIAHRLHQLHPVESLAELDTADRLEMHDHPLRVFRLGIQSRAYGRTADAEVAQIVSGARDAVAVAFYCMSVGGELLAEAHRRRVLEMGATGLHDRVERLAFRQQGAA